MFLCPTVPSSLVTKWQCESSCFRFVCVTLCLFFPCVYSTGCNGDVSVPRQLHPHSLQGGSGFCVCVCGFFIIIFLIFFWGGGGGCCCHFVLLAPCVYIYIDTACSGDVSVPHLFHPHSLSVKWGCHGLLLSVWVQRALEMFLCPTCSSLTRCQ